MSFVNAYLGKKPSRVIYMYSIIIGIIVEMKKKRRTIISIFYILLKLISGIRFVERLKRGDGITY